jgi:hypothetical protein
MGKTQKQWVYPLEQLYEDQEPELVVDAIAHLIAWLDPEDRQRSHRFELREVTRREPVEHELVVSWNIAMLAERDTRLEADLERFRARRTLTLEDQTKYAAYGLAMVAISCLLRRRVVDVSFFRPPDLLLDSTPAALRGVEVAGRGTKGYSAFTRVLDGSSGSSDWPGKRHQLVARDDIAEAYVSLWCREPRVSIWERVKP